MKTGRYASTDYVLLMDGDGQHSAANRTAMKAADGATWSSGSASKRSTVVVAGRAKVADSTSHDRSPHPDLNSGSGCFVVSRPQIFHLCPLDSPSRET